MKANVILILMMTVTSGCAGMRFLHTPAETAIFFGEAYRGQGLYLTNLTEPQGTDTAHLHLNDITNKLPLRVFIANGYRSEVLLRTQDDEVFSLGEVTCFDADGDVVCKTLGGLRTTYFGGRFTCEVLPPAGSSPNSTLLPCCCSTASFGREPSLTFTNSDAAVGDPVPDRQTLILPDDAYRIETQIHLRLKYVVLSKPGWHDRELILRTCAFRKHTPTYKRIRVLLFNARDGAQGILMQGRRVTSQQLGQAIAQAKTTRNDVRATIRSTEDAPQALVEEVVDVFRKAGVRDLDVVQM